MKTPKGDSYLISDQLNPLSKNSGGSDCSTLNTNKIICCLFSMNYPLVYQPKSVLQDHDEKMMIPEKEKVYNFQNLSVLFT